jgi:hypothetical protein
MGLSTVHLPSSLTQIQENLSPNVLTTMCADRFHLKAVTAIGSSIFVSHRGFLFSSIVLTNISVPAYCMEEKHYVSAK